MDYSYSYDVKENMAKAVARNLNISPKHAIEICRFIRGKPLERAKTILGDVVQKKQAVPFKRFYHNVGFKKKIGPGRYPVKAADEILNLLNNVTNNAQLKGLATGKLEICHIATKKGTYIMKRGRQIRRKMKQCHVEVVVKEMAKTKEPAKEVKKEEKKVEPKKEVKPVKKVEKPKVKEEKKVEEPVQKQVKEVKKEEPKKEKQVEEKKPVKKEETKK